MAKGIDDTGILVKCRVHPFGLLLIFCKTTMRYKRDAVQ